MAADPFDVLGGGEPGPLYWVCGKERFLVDRAVSRIRDAVLDARTRDFNYDLLYAKEAGAQKILQAARTLPMMARRRMVLVRDADAFDAKALEPFLSYLDDPAPETCLLFVAADADMRQKKFFTAFARRGEIIKCEPLKDRQVPSFLRDEAKARKVKFEAGAAELLAEEVGADLGQLSDAVERLELYVAGKGTERVIRAEDVEAVVATTRQRSVFELIDAIAEGSVGRSLAALGSLQAAREPALKTLALIVRLVRQLLMVRDLLDQRKGRGDIASALGLPPFLVEKLESQARRHTTPSLKAMHAAVYRADRALKSSKVEDERLMEALVIDLARAGSRAADRSSGRRQG